MQPAWIDEDDERIRVNLKSKNRLKKLIPLNSQAKSIISGNDFQKALQSHNHKLYDWALSKTDTQPKSNIDNLLQTTKRATKQITNQESYLRVKDLSDVHRSVLTSVIFSPHDDEVLLTAGLDRMLRIHNLMTSTKTQVDTVDMPIYSSGFINPEEILLTGRRKHCYLYDLQSQRLCRIIPNVPSLRSLERCFINPYSNVYAITSLEGNAYLFDSKTKQLRHALKVNGAVQAVAFARENYVFMSGEQAEIYVFDVRNSFKCLSKFTDEGSLETLTMDCSPSSWKYLASGQKSGIVNLYDLDDILLKSSEVKPFKVMT